MNIPAPPRNVMRLRRQLYQAEVELEAGRALADAVRDFLAGPSASARRRLLDALAVYEERRGSLERAGLFPDERPKGPQPASPPDLAELAARPAA